MGDKSLYLVSGALFMFLSPLMFVWGLSMIRLDWMMVCEWEMVTLNSSPVVYSVIADWMGILFMSVVMLISGLVMIYSGAYMGGDKDINRFIYIVSLFVLSMGFLIISPNMISILLGWDGLGLVSYCLVIYYQSSKSFNAGMLTALSNRVGDVMILMAIAWMFSYGEWNFISIVKISEWDPVMQVISVFIVVAAMTSSAQIPFSSWLPAAMAAPTPVSSLVHSSTLVTAGVFLLVRFSKALVYSGHTVSILLVMSGLTMFMAGLGANYEMDLKKIIALSTLSQLGFMVVILCLGFSKLAYFHLLTHALFKALLFMCAGSMIHNLSDSQDIRLMGGISGQMPVSSACFVLSNFSLCGLPFLAGFYSKDLILEKALSSDLNLFMAGLYLVSTGLTVSYTVRLVSYSMSGVVKESSAVMWGEEDWGMVYPMMILSSMAVVGGAGLLWMFSSTESVVLPLSMSTSVIQVTMAGAMLGTLTNLSFVKTKAWSGASGLYGLTSFSGGMWFMPSLSTHGLIFFPLKTGAEMFTSCDQGWSEVLGPQGGFYTFVLASKRMEAWQMNSLKFLFIMLVVWGCLTVALFVVERV
uniref:NADH dehydrogenase subunit 5 n=1 Tax=Apachyus feae TaxID=2914707 RepID=UPI001EF9EEB1|nr:NADH dehydrogenase subunit 5 [Apachyus feae]UKE80568.1 NADH dehydrogenase subunit 5 [Apachyus feae]